MNTTRTGQLIAAAGGAVLIVSLFLPWAETDAFTITGWELLAMSDAYLLSVGVAAIVAALTGGRFGLFRRDLSLNAATDLLGIVATLLLAKLLILDFPEETSREIGPFVALISTIAVMGGAGDYSSLRGAPAFPPLEGDERGTAGTG
jgi:hypothetical protein